MINPNDQQLLAEALRRRMGQTPSSSGISGGASIANNNSMGNPVATMGMTPMQNTGQSKVMPPAGDAENPTRGAQSMLQDAKPGEAEMIIKALSKRLDKIA